MRHPGSSQVLLDGKFQFGVLLTLQFELSPQQLELHGAVWSGVVWCGRNETSELTDVLEPVKPNVELMNIKARRYLRGSFRERKCLESEVLRGNNFGCGRKKHRRGGVNNELFVANVRVIRPGDLPKIEITTLER